MQTSRTDYVDNCFHDCFSAKIQQLVVNDSMKDKLETLLEQILSNRYGNDVEIEVKKRVHEALNEK